MATPERLAAEARVAALLDAGDTADAAHAVGEYECSQPRPRGIGTDWTTFPRPIDLRVLESIYGTPPAILAGVRADSLGLLRRAAAMTYLWGQSKVRRLWLPRDTDTGTRFSADVAARMLEFAARYEAQLDEYEKLSTRPQRYRLAVVGDARTCSACRALATGRFTRAALPELPHAQCTSPDGCRCIPMPTTD